MEKTKKLDEKMKYLNHLFVTVVVFTLVLPLRGNLKGVQIQKTIKNTGHYLKYRT